MHWAWPRAAVAARRSQVQDKQNNTSCCCTAHAPGQQALQQPSTSAAPPAQSTMCRQVGKAHCPNKGPQGGKGVLAPSPAGQALTYYLCCPLIPPMLAANPVSPTPSFPVTTAVLLRALPPQPHHPGPHPGGGAAGTLFGICQEGGVGWKGVWGLSLGRLSRVEGYVLQPGTLGAVALRLGAGESWMP